MNIKNRRAHFDFFFLEDFNAGIQLSGSEVKAIRDGKISLVDSFCYFKSGELFLKGATIPSTANHFSHDPNREKKLLLKRRELEKIQRKLEKGTTIIVKRVFTNDRDLIKVEISLAKGKKNYDKRNTIKERDLDRESKREF
jgi:SsrA-binding protein